MSDVQRIAALVKEYWNRGQDSAWYRQELDKLTQEIGQERVERARDDYENDRMALCEADEDRRG